MLKCMMLITKRNENIPPEYTSCSSPDAFNQIENKYLNLFPKYKKVFVGR